MTTTPAIFTTDTDEPQPKCLRPGIWRHWAPPVDCIEFNGEECVDHVMSTCDAGPVVGQLIRWVTNDGEVTYETRINGLEDSGGVSDAATFDRDSTAALACVANNLRYEWDGILRGDWSYQWTTHWPNERFPEVK